MTSGTSFVTIGCSHCSVLFCAFEQMANFFSICHIFNLEIAYVYLIGFCVDFFYVVLQAFFSGQKISDFFVVNLQKAGFQFVTPTFFYKTMRFFKNFGDGFRNDAQFLHVFISFHGVCFTTSGLSIGKNANIVPINCTLD